MAPFLAIRSILRSQCDSINKCSLICYKYLFQAFKQINCLCAGVFNRFFDFIYDCSMFSILIDRLVEKTIYFVFIPWTVWIFSGNSMWRNFYFPLWMEFKSFDVNFFLITNSVFICHKNCHLLMFFFKKESSFLIAAIKSYNRLPRTNTVKMRTIKYSGRMETNAFNCRLKH